jgi:hypothetical protein
MDDKTVTIERTTETGYVTKTYAIGEALEILNQELENERTIWIDGKPFFGDGITEDDVLTCKKEISVTNRLIGG